MELHQNPDETGVSSLDDHDDDGPGRSLLKIQIQQSQVSGRKEDTSKHKHTSGGEGRSELRGAIISSRRASWLDDSLTPLNRNSYSVSRSDFMVEKEEA